MVKVKGPEKEPGIILLSRKDMSDRENRYLQRMQDVSVSCNFIREATMEYERLETQQAHEAHWEHFIRCDGLPRTYLPPEMRTFIAKKQHYQQYDYDHTVDWTLSVDERTILTQNIFRIDKTRKAMKAALTDHVGDRFERDVCMYLDTLMKIECMLDNNAEMARVDFQRQMEIMEVRSEMEKEIDASFDRMTYRVIRMDGVYMESSDATVATWGHNCERFSIDIWGLRNVPVRFEELLAPLMVAELEHVGVSVQMPLSVLHDCLTLRCIHTKFDNYSQYAKSFDPMIPESMKDLTAGIVDIEDCLANEWIMQLDIQEEMLESMLQKREEYDEIMRIIVEKTERAAKEKKGDEGKKAKGISIPKAPKEPPLILPGMLPDAYPTFLEREQQEYEDMLDQLYNPENQKLQMDEINLRECIMLGGLYSIMFVRRPSNTHFEKFNIILHEDGRILRTMEDVVADLTPADDLSGRGSRLSKRQSKLSAGRSSKMRMNMDPKRRKTTMLEDDELPFFFVTLQLPKELCLWGEPIVCQYMTTMQEVVSEDSLVEDKKESIVAKKKKSKFESIKRSVEVEQVQSVFNKITRKDASINVFRPTLISMLRQSKHVASGERVAAINNFPLLKLLNHMEIRQLERFGGPRLISSFKFPMEVREELEQLHDSRPKTRNVLIRRRSADIEENVDFGYVDFSFKDQHAPERMFPAFNDIETVIYGNEIEGDEEYNPKKTMFGLLETFNDIRMDYETKYVGIMNQADFGSKKDKTKKTVVPLGDTRNPSVGARIRSLIKPSSRQSSIRESHLALPSSPTSSRTGSSTQNIADVTSDVVSFSEQSSHTEEKQEKPKIKVIHWTKKHIISSNFNRKERTMTIRTDRLGIFGLAFKRYEHFPFRDWSMQPNEENPEEITLIVDTFHARIVLYISAKGVRGYVTDIVKGYVANPVKYLDIQTPISDFRVLRKRFYDKCINIFAEHDASYYIDNGYFSVKHVATEDHTYDAMALHCKLMKFYRSSWNRLASRRNILLCMKNAKDQSDYSEVTIRLTPDSATFVEVSELCSDDLDIIKLDFKNTWRNMGNYTDLHQTINSMNPHATDVRNKDAMLLFRIKRMLSEIHLMSYS